MITGSGSAELYLSYSLTAADGIGAAGLGLDFSGEGYIVVQGDGSAALGLSVAKGVSISGAGSGRLRLSAHGSGQIQIVGQGGADLMLFAAPSGGITITGEGEAAIGLAARLAGFIRAVMVDEGIQGWVINAKTRGPAVYSNFPVNSLFKLQGQYFGCTSQGIVRLSGNRDDGTAIQARARFGLSDCGGAVKKRFPEARVVCRNEGLMELSVTVDEKKEIVYEVAAREGLQGIHTKRVPLAKGVRGQVVQIEWRNVQGSDFDIQQTELDVEYLRRR